MRISLAWCKGEHFASYRYGEWAEIVGVRMVQPDDDSPWRPCFVVRFKDGTEDHWPIYEDPARLTIAGNVSALKITRVED